MNRAINANQQSGIDALSRYLPGNPSNSGHTLPSASHSVLQQSTSALAVLPSPMQTRSSVAQTLPQLASNPLLQSTLPALTMRQQPDVPISSVGTMMPQTVQSNHGSLPTSVAVSALTQQIHTGSLSDIQMAADQKVQIGLMSLKVPLPDDVNIEIGKNHMVYESEDYFFDVLTYQDLEKEKANFELMNEIANEVNRENAAGAENERDVVSLAAENAPGTSTSTVTSTITPTTSTIMFLNTNTLLASQSTNTTTSVLPNTTTTVTTTSSPLFSV